jgi:hypothetical protein
LSLVDFVTVSRAGFCRAVVFSRGIPLLS